MTKFQVLDFNLVTCEVCFEESSGDNFLRLVSCNEHVLCKKCSSNWFEEQIKQGAVTDMTCPGYKCEKQVLPTEVSVSCKDIQYNTVKLKTFKLNVFDEPKDISSPEFLFSLCWSFLNRNYILTKVKRPTP